MAGTGGARVGAGRKPKTEEDRVRDLAVQSIKRKFGSEIKGFKALLASGEATLIRFVFEHAFGKPKEKMEHSGQVGIIWNEVKNYGTKPKANDSP